MAGRRQGKVKRWRWIGARSTGTSHLKTGDGCEDSAACVEWTGRDGSVLIAAVSDGAGSARYAEVGSRLVARGVVRAALRHVARTPIDKIGHDCVAEWLDGVRDAIGFCASTRAGIPRDFAATLVCAIVFYDRIVVAHVGDGACVGKTSTGEWVALSWPEHGEYASTTYFVTDDPAPKLRVISLDESFTQIALFTDGIERLALDFTKIEPSPRFFDPVFKPLLGDIATGRDRVLSGHLKRFLDSAQVTNSTDDDKTLILAARSSEQ